MAASRVKSPHYPSINLETAIAKARDLVNKVGRGPLSRETAIAGLGLSPKSSSGQRTAAALLAFGLWEKAGKGQVRLSDRGRRILVAPDFSMAAKEITEAALMPRIHRRVLQQWPEGLPQEDAGMLGFLRMEWDFNPDAAAPFIRELRETFAFAKVSAGATIDLDLGDGDEDDEDDDSPSADAASVEPPPVRRPQHAPAPTPPAPSTPGHKDPRTMELTSFPLAGGGRLVLEVPLPTPAGQFQRLAALSDGITKHLSQFLAKAEETKPDPAPSAQE